MYIWPYRKVIVYFLTCACVDYFATALEEGGPVFPVKKEAPKTVALHGKMKQAQREAALAQFAANDAVGPGRYCPPRHREEF